MTNPPFEITTGKEVRLKSKSGLKNADGSADWYLSLSGGKLIPNGGPSNNSTWIVTVNSSDNTFTLQSKSNTTSYLGINDQLKVISNADINGTGKFEFFWQENGKLCLMSHQFKDKQNLTGKNGPHLGLNPKEEIIGNAGRGPWGQWTLVEGSSVESKSGSLLSASGSPAMQLLTNLPYHKELWNQRFTIDRQLTKTVKASLNVTYTLPNMKVSKWCVVSPAPPVLQCQNIKNASLKVYDSTGENILSGSNIIQSGAYNLFRSLAKGNNEHSIQAKYEIEAELYSITLKKLDNSGSFIPPVYLLSPQERAYHLQPTSYIDFQNPTFIQWVQSNQLHPLLSVDGSVESLLCYAYRVFLFIKIHFSYVFAKDVKGRKASDTIQSKANDCGGFVILFSAIMRMHGIPSRLLCGRWGNSGTQTEQRYHVKGEFYCDGVGWVPFDTSSAITGDHDTPYTKFFATDKGEFIVMHLDHGINNIDASLGFDKPVQSEFIQGQAFWVNGTGNENNKTVVQNWVVEKQ